MSLEFYRNLNFKMYAILTFLCQIGLYYITSAFIYMMVDIQYILIHIYRKIRCLIWDIRFAFRYTCISLYRYIFVYEKGSKEIFSLYACLLYILYKYRILHLPIYINSEADSQFLFQNFFQSIRLANSTPCGYTTFYMRIQTLLYKIK